MKASTQLRRRQGSDDSDNLSVYFEETSIQVQAPRPPEKAYRRISRSRGGRKLRRDSP